MRSKAVSIVLVAVVICLAFGQAMAKQDWDSSADLYQAGDVKVTDAQKEAGNPIFLIVMEDGQTICGELYPDVAPQTVGNFVALANSGFYDGLVFHRVIPGFVVQAGCPLGQGTGNPGWHIQGEFAVNGIANGLAHSTGILSMARSSAYDSAGSQFFIMTGDSPHLDGQYAAFGKVLEGMDVVQAIANAQRDGRDKPYEDQRMKSIRVETFGQTYPFDKIN